MMWFKVSRPRFGVFTLVFFLYVVLPASLWGQSRLTGRVIDPSGAAIANAVVRVQGAQGKLVQSGTTGPDGRFTFAGLTAGVYTVEVESEGFAAAREEVRVSGGATAVEIGMQVGGVQERITVRAERTYRVESAATATKTSTPIIDTPAAVQVVPLQVMQDQQVIRLSEAVKNISSVQPLQGAGVQGEAFTVRGFDQGFFYRDGYRMPRFTARFPEMANVERVEVLKGPATVLFGRTEPGGVINMVTERPQPDHRYSFQQQLGSYSRSRTTFDATGPLTGGRGVQYLFNIAYDDANSFRDFVENETFFVNPQIGWDVTPKTRVRGWLEYFDDERTLDQGLVALGDGPAPIRRETFIGNPNDFNENEYVRTGANLTSELSPQWTFRSTFLYDDTTRLDQRARPRDTDGDGIALNEMTGELEREVVANNPFFFETYFLTGNFEGRFERGGVRHTLLIGVDYNDFSYDGDFPVGEIGPINIFNPVHDQEPRNIVNSGSFFGGDEWLGLYFQDQISVANDRLHFLVGGRFDDTRAQTGFGTSFNIEPENSDFSPRFGVLVKARNWLSVYGSYTESFSGNSTFSRNREGEPFDPETAEQWEAGVKSLLFGGRMSLTAAAFQLTKKNITVPDPEEPQFSTQIGEARSTGLEIDVSGEIARGWNLVASYAWLPEAEVTRDTTGIQGNRLFNAPESSGSLWLTYSFRGSRLLQGLRLGAGFFGADERSGDNANSFSLPGYGRVDAMASYTWHIGDLPWTLQLNVENLFDNEYFASAGNSRLGGIRPGAPLTVLGAFRVEF